MSKELGLIKSIFTFSISTWINIIIGLIFTIITTRILVPETYGTVSVFISASNTLMYIVCLGLDASFIRFYNERPNNEPQNLFLFKLICIISFNTLVVFFISTTFMFDWFNKILFGRMSWFLTILLFGSVYSNLLLRFFNINYRMSFNIKEYTIQNILIKSSMKFFTLIAALVNPSSKVVIAFQVIGIMGIALIYMYLQRKEIFPQKINISLSVKKQYKGYSPIFRYALFSAPLYISTNLNVLLTQQVIMNVLGSDSLGIYSAVNIFTTLYGAVQTGFSTFWSAYIYKYYNCNQEKISIMTDYVMIVAIISLGGFVLFRQTLYMFIGVDYQSSITFFSMVLMVNIINLIAQSTIYGIDIVKKNYITAITNCIYVCINVVMVYFAASSWGLVGVAYAVMIARLVLFIVNTIIGQFYYKTIINRGKFVVGLVIALFIAIIPSINFEFCNTNILVIVLLLLSMAVYKKQYIYIVNIVKKKINSAI